jgi:hypothetical protein
MPERVGRSLMGTVKLGERRAEEAIFLRDELSVLRLGRIGAGFPNQRDFDSTCWLGGGQQECRGLIRKTCVTA